MVETNKTSQPTSPRRHKARLATLLPGQLTTMYGTENIVLHDLSLTGAKVGLSEHRGIEEPLREGIDAVLTWNGHETFGQLMWIAPDSVGIEFEDNIGTKALVETRRIQDRMAESGGLDSHAERVSNQAAKGWARGGVRI